MASAETDTQVSAASDYTKQKNASATQNATQGATALQNATSAENSDSTTQDSSFWDSAGQAVSKAGDVLSGIADNVTDAMAARNGGLGIVGSILQPILNTEGYQNKKEANSFASYQRKIATQRAELALQREQMAMQEYVDQSSQRALNNAIAANDASAKWVQQQLDTANQVMTQIVNSNPKLGALDNEHKQWVIQNDSSLRNLAEFYTIAKSYMTASPENKKQISAYLQSNGYNLGQDEGGEFVTYQDKKIYLNQENFEKVRNELVGKVDEAFTAYNAIYGDTTTPVGRWLASNIDPLVRGGVFPDIKTTNQWLRQVFSNMTPEQFDYFFANAAVSGWLDSTLTDTQLAAAQELAFAKDQFGRSMLDRLGVEFDPGEENAVDGVFRNKITGQTYTVPEFRKYLAERDTVSKQFDSARAVLLAEASNKQTRNLARTDYPFGVRGSSNNNMLSALAEGGDPAQSFAQQYFSGTPQLNYESPASRELKKLNEEKDLSESAWGDNKKSPDAQGENNASKETYPGEKHFAEQASKFDNLKKPLVSALMDEKLSEGQANYIVNKALAETINQARNYDAKDLNDEEFNNLFLENYNKTREDFGLKRVMSTGLEPTFIREIDKKIEDIENEGTSLQELNAQIEKARSQYQKEYDKLKNDYIKRTNYSSSDPSRDAMQYRYYQNAVKALDEKYGLSKLVAQRDEKEQKKLPLELKKARFQSKINADKKHKEEINARKERLENNRKAVDNILGYYNEANSGK